LPAVLQRNALELPSMQRRAYDLVARRRPSAATARLGGKVQYRLWQLATALGRRLPLRLSYGIARAAGSSAYYLWPRGRRSMARNYARVMPWASRREVRRIARRSLVNYCCYLIDFIRFPSLAPADFIADVAGEESFHALDAALARGKGVIVVCMHFGNWDLGAGATAARGYPLTVVAETFADPRLNKMVVDSRQRLGMAVVKMERAGPSLLRALKQNGILALLIDRPIAGDGVKVQFFGEEVEVPAGPARLALRSGAIVVPTAFPRLKRASLAVSTLADFEIMPAETGNKPADIQRLTQAIMDSHERFVRAYPDQWYMFREMWPETRR